MKSYLIEYHRKQGSVSVTEFLDPDEAIRERLKLDQVREDPDLEIAVIVAASLEALRSSHSRYFSREDVHHEAKSA